MATLPGVHPHRNSQSERGSAKHDPRSDYGTKSGSSSARGRAHTGRAADRSAEKRGRKGQDMRLSWLRLDRELLASIRDAIDTERLLAEDSFTGDLLRLVRKEQERIHDSDGVVAKGLEPLMEHAEIRSLLDETSPEEMLDWVRRAEELTLGLLLRDRSREEGDGR